MRIYFVSAVAAALKLGGVYVGILNKNEQFMDIDLNDNIFCEILPADPKKLPINFILNRALLENPPENMEVYNLQTCYRISAVKFYGAMGGKLKVIFQTRIGKQNTLVTLFSEQNSRLMLENESGFVFEDVPGGFEVKNCYHKEFMGEDLIVIKRESENKVLLIFSESKNKLIFKNVYNSYSFDDVLNIEFSFTDILKHTGSAKWVISSDTFVMKDYSVKECADLTSLPARLLPFVFFEKIMCGGNPKKFLSDALKPRTADLKKYLGEFIDVIPPPFNIDEKYVGLIYAATKNKYFAKYFNAEINGGEIVNITPLEVDKNDD